MIDALVQAEIPHWRFLQKMQQLLEMYLQFQILHLVSTQLKTINSEPIKILGRPQWGCGKS